MNLDEKDRQTEGKTDKMGEKPKCAMVYDKLRGTRTKRHNNYTKPRKIQGRTNENKLI